jgi:DNA-binding NarL/FixJ family response regulator
VVRTGIRALLEGLAGVKVAPQVIDGRDALRLVKTLQPDAVLIFIAYTGAERLGNDHAFGQGATQRGRT